MAGAATGAMSNTFPLCLYIEAKINRIWLADVSDVARTASLSKAVI